MAFGSTLKDSGGVPISQEYVPNTGFIALGGHPGAGKDANSNQYTAATMHYIQPSVVQQANAVTGSAGKTLNVVFGSATTQGNTIIVVLGMGEVQSGATITLAVTDSQSNSYSQAAFASQSTTLEASIFSALITTAGATTVTITIAGASSTNTAIAAEIYEIAGLVPMLSSGALDQTATANNAGATAVSVGAVAPTQGNEYAFVALASAGGTITAGTGLLLDSGTLAPTGGGLVSMGALRGYLPSNAAFSGTATLSASNAWAAAIATFRTATVPVSGQMLVGNTRTNPAVTQDFIRSLIANGQVFSTGIGDFTAYTTGFFPISLFNSATSGKNILIFAIEAFNFTNGANLTQYIIQQLPTDQNYNLTTGGFNLTPVNIGGSASSVLHVSVNVQNAQAPSGVHNLINNYFAYNQALFMNILTNGMIFLLPAGTANDFIFWQQAYTGGHFSYSLIWAEY